DRPEIRRLLRVPEDAPFRVLPRLEGRKTIFHGASMKGQTHELLFKVAWDFTEPNAGGTVLPRFRHVTAGTTMVMDWDTATIRAIVTTEVSDQQREEQRAARDRLLLRLLDEDVIKVGPHALGTDGRLLRSAI